MAARLAFLPQASKPELAWRRLGFGLLAAAGAALWLASLPSLLARDGLTPGREGCRSLYRDPVTGRPATASGRTGRCPAAMGRARP